MKLESLIAGFWIGIMSAWPLASPAQAQPAADQTPEKHRVAAVQGDISQAAADALANAEADVKAAIAAKSLWTTADEALKRAREAAAKDDSAEVIKQSAIASEQARLGIEQTRYPLAQ